MESNQRQPGVASLTTKGSANPILIVDDDPQISSLISSALRNEGFATLTGADGEEALALAAKHDPALIILDLMLPKIDGIEVCRDIRRRSDTPILILTVKADEFDKILGLAIGADDYLTKPFSPRELIARVKAILRRSLHRPNATAKRFRHLGLDLDFEKRKVMVGGEEVALTVYEYKILEALAHAPGIALSREQLIQRIYAYEDVSVVDRVIDVHVGNLRAKIEEDPSHPRYIITVRGIGYKFAEIDSE